jgi:Fe-S-cluster containining protein
MKTCSQCFDKCKGECCRWVPLTIKFIEAHKDKIQREVFGSTPHNGNERVVYLITKIDKITETAVHVKDSDQICAFLDSNNHCVVYNDRPEICRCFGTTCQPDNTFTCHYHLGKDYSFPKDNTIEKALIDKASAEGKYAEQLNNPKLIKEILGI